MQLQLIIGLLLFATIGFAQSDEISTKEEMSDLPYHEIPEAPETFTATTVAARMIDGLGFRYYWGTEGLSSENLKYKPSESGRTIQETLEHIDGLCRTVLNAVKGVPNTRVNQEDKSYATLRSQTLNRLKEASDLLRAADPEQMENMKVIFQRGDSSSEYPFWNLLNGPLADALWHVGQVVSHRRAAGNPLSGNISVFSGKVRN